MGSPGTYSFDPKTANLVINAFAKCGVTPPQITAEHIANASFEANLLNVELSNRNPNGFALETITQVLTTAASYTLTGRIVSIASVYVTNSTDGTSKIITPISASQYAAISEKTDTATGGPNCYFFQSLKTPKIWPWPLVSSTDTVTYTLNIMVFHQNEDFIADWKYTTDLPYRYLDAFAMGLAARLADIYNPERAERFYKLYTQKVVLMESQDQEDVGISIIPDMSGYRP